MMLNYERDPQTDENTEAEYHTTADASQHSHQYQSPSQSIPRITIHEADQTSPRDYNSGSATETEMSSSSHHHRSSGSVSKKSSSKSKVSSKKDDWSDITDPEERRRVQNRIAQRKFRDKAKEAKERQERDATNRAHAHGAYHVPSSSEMSSYSASPEGLPWGSLSLVHVFSKGHAKESQSRRGSYSHSHSSSHPRSHHSMSMGGHSPFEPADGSFGDDLEIGHGGEDDGLFDDSGSWDDGTRGGYFGGGYEGAQGSGEGSYGGSSR